MQAEEMTTVGQEPRGTTATKQEQRNLELMQTLDDAWNSQAWDTFEKRHKVDTVVRWPAQPPTFGVHDHRAESVQLFKTFPDNRTWERPAAHFSES